MVPKWIFNHFEKSFWSAESNNTTYKRNMYAANQCILIKLKVKQSYPWENDNISQENIIRRKPETDDT